MSAPVDLWLVQYLCPARHAIAASPYDRTKTTPEAHEQTLLAQMDGFHIERRCGLCGSRDLHFEHGKLRSDDWEVVMPLLRALEAANLTAMRRMARTRAENN